MSELRNQLLAELAKARSEVDAAQIRERIRDLDRLERETATT